MECGEDGAKNRLAAVLILGSAVSASLQSFDAKYLSSSLHWSAISFAINAASLPVLTVASVGRRTGHLGWLACRSLLGGIALNAAIAGVTHLNLASANTIMFSMPLWACGLTCALERKLPSRPETIRLVGGFTGTCFVSGWHGSLVGLGGAFGFALCNAGACVITARKLQGAAPSVVCAAQAFVALVLSSVVLRGPLPLSWLLVFEVLSFPLSLILRTSALLISHNAHVLSLLYTEIPLVLLWDRLFCNISVEPVQAIGLTLIIASVVLSNSLPDKLCRMENYHRLQSREDDFAALVLAHDYSSLAVDTPLVDAQKRASSHDDGEVSP